MIKMKKKNNEVTLKEEKLDFAACLEMLKNNIVESNQERWARESKEYHDYIYYINNKTPEDIERERKEKEEKDRFTQQCFDDEMKALEYLKEGNLDKFLEYDKKNKKEISYK